MGAPVTTLADLLCPGLKAVVIGINPAPVSVTAGHYWQGNTGRTLWRRLERVGLLPIKIDGYEDDAAFAAGVGFTDVVKRPTASASGLKPGELEHGIAVLEDKLAATAAPLVIVVFKAAAVALFGTFSGNGFIGKQLGPCTVFVMPGPYEAAATADKTLQELKEWLDGTTGA